MIRLFLSLVMMINFNVMGASQECTDALVHLKIAAASSGRADLISSKPQLFDRSRHEAVYGNEYTQGSLVKKENLDIAFELAQQVCK